MDGLNYIDIHTHSPQEGITSIYSLYNLKDILPLQKNVFYSVGLHPWYLDYPNWESAKKDLEVALKWPHIIAFGECGLDRVKGAPFSLQIEYFKHQLEFFKSSNLKVCFIHCVRAWSELIPLICPKDQSFKDKVFILHDFNSSIAEFEKLNSYKNLYFSLGQNFMRPQSRIHHFLDQIPQDRLFFESDGAKRTIQELYQSYVENPRTHSSIQQLIKIIEQNYQRLFS